MARASLQSTRTQTKDINPCAHARVDPNMQAMRQHREVVEVTHPNDAEVASSSLQEGAYAQEIVHTCWGTKRKDMALKALHVSVFNAPQRNNGLVKVHWAQGKLLVGGLQIHRSDPQIGRHRQPLRMDKTVQQGPIGQSKRNRSTRLVKAHQENRSPHQMVQGVQASPSLCSRRHHWLCFHASRQSGAASTSAQPGTF